MLEKERVEEVRFFFKKNKTEFSKILGYTTSQSYTNYLSGGNNLSMKMIKALKKYEPKLSVDWLLDGQGQMLLGNGNQKVINGDGNNNESNNSDNINSNNKEIEILKNKIEFLEKALEEKDERLKDKDERLKDKDRLISMLEKNQK